MTEGFKVHKNANKTIHLSTPTTSQATGGSTSSALICRDEERSRTWSNVGKRERERYAMRRDEKASSALDHKLPLLQQDHPSLDMMACQSRVPKLAAIKLVL